MSLGPYFRCVSSIPLSSRLFKGTKAKGCTFQVYGLVMAMNPFVPSGQFMIPIPY